MRPTWDEYFMQIARDVGTRSTCLRRHVSAVIVRDKRILSTGYNGAPRGVAHCEEVGCLREKLGIPSGQRQEICRGLHAEQNAIIQAALHGVSIEGATIYCTHQPCITCAKMIINAGIVRVVCANAYPDEFSRGMLEEASVQLEIWNSDTSQQADQS
jgi:dCMP deaminase